MHWRTISGGALSMLATLGPCSAALASERVPTITFVDGSATIVSGGQAYVAATGVRLRQCDIVRTAAQALVQVEREDGSQVVLGPGTRFLFDLPHSGESVVGQHVLLSGWAKVSLPKRESATPYRISTPHFDLLIEAGVTALRIAADRGQFFVEEGKAVVLAASGSAADRASVGPGRMYTRSADQGQGSIGGSPDPAFVADMPRPMRDTLPALLPALKARDVQPKPAADAGPAETEAWLQALPEYRQCSADVAVRRAQQALARGGFDVGPIDGILGSRTRKALLGFQQRRGLPPSGQLDTQTLKALDETDGR